MILYIEIYTILAIIYCAVRNYLETEAMSKAIFVAKEYMEDYARENEEITENDIDKLLNNFDTLNKIGIPMTNFCLVAGTIVKMIILAVLALL